MSGSLPGRGSYPGIVNRFSRADRPYAVAAAVAHDLNNELTVILNCVAMSLEMIHDGHPAVPLLLDLQDAANRCAWRAAALLNFSARKGVLAAPIPVERLIE